MLFSSVYPAECWGSTCIQCLNVTILKQSFTLSYDVQVVPCHFVLSIVLQKTVETYRKKISLLCQVYKHKHSYNPLSITAPDLNVQNKLLFTSSNSMVQDLLFIYSYQHSICISTMNKSKIFGSQNYSSVI